MIVSLALAAVGVMTGNLECLNLDPTKLRSDVGNDFGLPGGKEKSSEYVDVDIK